VRNGTQKALRRTQLAVVAGFVFLAVGGWGSPLGEILGLPALVGLPLSGALGFALLLWFHRAVRRALDPRAPDESRLLGFLVPAIVPFLRPFVELGLLLSAAGFEPAAPPPGARGPRGVPQRGSARALVMLAWTRAAIDLFAWGAVLSSSSLSPSLTAGAAVLSVVTLAAITHLIAQPALEAISAAGAGAPPDGRSACCEDPFAVSALERPLAGDLVGAGA
jgi:hypothetical protein